MARSARNTLMGPPAGGMMAARSGEQVVPQQPVVTPSATPTTPPAGGMMAARANEVAAPNTTAQVAPAATQTTAPTPQTANTPQTAAAPQTATAPTPYILLEQQTQAQLARQQQEQALEQAARPMAYEEFFKATQPDPEYTPEQERAIANRERREKLFGALNDGIVALGNVAMTGAGALNQQMTFQSPTAKERWDKFNAQHQANVQAYRNGLGQAREKDRAERARQQAHQLAVQKEARETATAQAKLQMDAQKLQLAMDKAAQEGDLNKAKLYEYQLKNYYYPMMRQAELKLRQAQTRSADASTRQKNAATRLANLRYKILEDEQSVTLPFTINKPSLQVDRNGRPLSTTEQKALQINSKYWRDDSLIDAVYNKISKHLDKTNVSGNEEAKNRYFTPTENMTTDEKRAAIAEFLQDENMSGIVIEQVSNLIDEDERNFKGAASPTKRNTKKDELKI